MTVLSLLQFAAKLTAAQHAVDATIPEIIEAACRMLCEQAKSEIGVPGWGWPPLAPDTLARKGNINTPLLETGELQESIAWNSSGAEGFVGTNDDKAAFHEFGTSRMPPRPFLLTAIGIKEEEIVSMARRAIVAAVIAGTSPVGELFEILKEAAHAARETVHEAKDMMEDDQ